MNWLIFALLAAFFAALTSILAVLFLREKVNFSIILGVILMTIGTFLIAFGK